MEEGESSNLQKTSLVNPGVAIDTQGRVNQDNEHFSQFSSGAQLCQTLCNPMDCSIPGLPVHHHLPESTQTHVHWVSDAIQTSHPLSSPSPLAFILCQNQGLFQGVSPSLSGGKSIGTSASASVLPVNIQNSFPKDLLVWPPCSPRDSQESFLTPQFKGSNSSALSLLYGPTSIHDYRKNLRFD